MNPRLVEPGFVVCCGYTPTPPLVLTRTTTVTTRRSARDDMEIFKIT